MLSFTNKKELREPTINLLSAIVQRLSQAAGNEWQGPVIMPLCTKAFVIPPINQQ